MTELPLAVQQQMAMDRPWDHAEPGSQWAIEGQRPGGAAFSGLFAFALPSHDEDTTEIVFEIRDMLTPAWLIPASWITHAKPLIIVHRDEPSRAFFLDDQQWIDEAVKP